MLHRLAWRFRPEILATKAQLQHVQRRRLGLFSGIRNLLGGDEAPRAYPTAEQRRQQAEGQGDDPAAGMSGLHRQRTLEATALEQRRQAGDLTDDAGETLSAGGSGGDGGGEHRLSQGLMGLVGSIESKKVSINASHVKTVGGNEAWAVTAGNDRALPGLPSRQDFGMAWGWDADAEKAQPGMLDQAQLSALLRECHHERQKLREQPPPPDAAIAAEEQLIESLSARHAIDASRLGSILESVSPVTVLTGGADGTKRLGVLSVPPSVLNLSIAAAAGADVGSSWRLAPSGQELMLPAGSSPSSQASASSRGQLDTRFLTDAQRAFAGMAPMEESERGISRRNQAMQQQQQQQKIAAEAAAAAAAAAAVDMPGSDTATPKRVAASTLAEVGGRSTNSQPTAARVTGLPWQRHVADLEDTELAGDDIKEDQGPTAADSRRVTTPSGLVIISFLEGHGSAPQAHDSVEVNYTGQLLEDIESGTMGAVFDQGHGSVLPLSQLIRGWREGLSLMRVGGRARLIIPSQEGYGALGTECGTVPPDAMLCFDVELVAIR